MGDHYASCREENCGVCGQLKGFCEHTSEQKVLQAAAPRANDIQHGGDHYKGAKFQHWDLISKNRIGYLEGCGSKYASRWRKKNGIEDVKKCIHYCDKLLEVLDEFRYKPTGRAPYSDLQLFFEQNDITDHDEQLIVAHLCTWDSRLCVELARKHALLLLAKAQRLAA
jgi:hypothetical protein